MKQMPIQPELFDISEFPELLSGDHPALYFYDDQPIEDILYGENTKLPSLANLYWNVRKNADDESE